MPANANREFLAAAITPSSLNAENRTVDCVFFSGAAVERRDWFKGENYMLAFDPGGADLSQLVRGPVFDNHAGDSAKATLGTIERAWRDGAEFKATLRFSKRDEVTPIWQDIADGIVSRFSMGVNLLEKKDTPAKDGKLRTVTATRWAPFEVSLAPLPADSKTRVLSAGDKQMNETVSMTTEDRATALKVIRLAPEGDRERITAMVDTESLATIRTEVINAQARESNRYGEIRNHHIDGGRDERDTFIPRAAEALACRYTGAAPSEAAREFMGASPVKLAERCLQLSGRRVPWTAGETIREALGGLHTTSDFPSLLEETGRRMLAAAYAAASPAIKKIARRSTAIDFKTKSVIRLGEAPQLLEVLEHGEVKRGSRASAKESYRLRTYARIFGITRQALINDDLGAFGDAARAWGTSAATLEGSMLTDLLVSNPTMEDSVALFHADHDNLDTPAALDVDGLSDARLLLRKTTGLDGATILDIAPRYLVVAAEQETVGEKVLTEITAATIDNANPFAGKLELVVDPRLPTGKFYLFADPNGPYGVLEYAYLDGQEGLAVETRVGFDVEGMEVKARIDYGVGVTGFRGAVRMDITP